MFTCQIIRIANNNIHPLLYIATPCETNNKQKCFVFAHGLHFNSCKEAHIKIINTEILLVCCEL